LKSDSRPQRPPNWEVSSLEGAFRGRVRETRALLGGLRGSLGRLLGGGRPRDLVDRPPSCPLRVDAGPLFSLRGGYSSVSAVRDVAVDGVRPAAGGAKSFKVLGIARVADASAVPPAIARPAAPRSRAPAPDVAKSLILGMALACRAALYEVVLGA
jgi:hypothetical protein